MKKLLLLILIVISVPTFGDITMSDPYLTHTKHEKKNMKHFYSLRRHKKNVSYKKRTGISHPSVKKETRKILRRKRFE